MSWPGDDLHEDCLVPGARPGLAKPSGRLRGGLAGPDNQTIYGQIGQYKIRETCALLRQPVGRPSSWARGAWGTRARGTIPFSITWETPRFGTNFALPRHSSAPSYPGLPPYVADNEALARHRASAEPEGRRHRQRSQKGTGRLSAGRIYLDKISTQDIHSETRRKVPWRKPYWR